MGTPRAPQGSPRLGSGRGRTNSPQIWPGPLLALPWAPSSLAGQRGRAGPAARTNGKRKGPCQDDPGYPGPQTKEMGFARDARGVCGTQSGDAVPGLGDGPGSWQHAPGVARGSRREGWARARGVSRSWEARHACSVPHFPGRAGDPAPGGGGRSAHAAAPTGAGSPAAASLSAGALPEPGLACAAAPRRRR